MRHRGPDWSGVWNNEHAVLAHQRLAIVDVENGAQPLESPSGQQVLAVNGEIYNHRTLEANLESPYAFKTKSDCEVISSPLRPAGARFPLTICKACSVLYFTMLSKIAT